MMLSCKLQQSRRLQMLLRGAPEFCLCAQTSQKLHPSFHSCCHSFPAGVVKAILCQKSRTALLTLLTCQMWDEKEKREFVMSCSPDPKKNPQGDCTYSLAQETPLLFADNQLMWVLINNETLTLHGLLLSPSMQKISKKELNLSVRISSF